MGATGGLIRRKKRFAPDASLVTVLRALITTGTLVTVCQVFATANESRNRSVNRTTENGQEITTFCLPGRRSIRSVRDASNMTVVLTASVLSPRLRSGSADTTVAVLYRTASTGGTTTIDTVKPVLLVRTPMLQVTTPLVKVHGPLVELADTKFTPSGNVSVNFTPVTIEGPLFVTISR